MAKRTLLINWVYYNPVGHVVEGLKLAAGFHKSNPDLEIHVALNSRSPVELTRGCPWVQKTYSIDVYDLAENGESSACLKGIPTEWDYVVSDYRPEKENKANSFDLSNREITEERGMLVFLNITERKFRIRRGLLKYGYKQNLPNGLRYAKTKLKITVPSQAIKFANRYSYKGLKVCLIPSGSSGWQYAPSAKSWRSIIKAIVKKFPNSKIYLTGISKSPNKRTYTGAFTKTEINFMLRSSPNVVNCYDIGFWNQIALFHTCDLLLAPHTGFGFVSSCVDTPWLVISGGDWPEYLFNHSPWYSVLPKEKSYPYVGKGRYTKHSPKGNKRNGRIPPFTDKNMQRKIPEILRAIRLLTEKSFTYERAMRTYKQNINRLGLDERKFHLEEVF